MTVNQSDVCFMGQLVSPKLMQTLRSKDSSSEKQAIQKRESSSLDPILLHKCPSPSPVQAGSCVFSASMTNLQERSNVLCFCHWWTQTQRTLPHFYTRCRILLNELTNEKSSYVCKILHSLEKRDTLFLQTGVLKSVFM